MYNFRKWLISQRGRNDSIGELARDFAYDFHDDARDSNEPAIPRRFTPVTAREYLLARGGCYGALRTLEAAASEWSRQSAC